MRYNSRGRFYLAPDLSPWPVLSTSLCQVCADADPQRAGADEILLMAAVSVPVLHVTTADGSVTRSKTPSTSRHVDTLSSVLAPVQSAPPTDNVDPIYCWNCQSLADHYVDLVSLLERAIAKTPALSVRLSVCLSHSSFTSKRFRT